MEPGQLGNLLPPALPPAGAPGRKAGPSEFPPPPHSSGGGAEVAKGNVSSVRLGLVVGLVRLFVRSVGWLFGCLVGWLDGWMEGWLVYLQAWAGLESLLWGWLNICVV